MDVLKRTFYVLFAESFLRKFIRMIGHDFKKESFKNIHCKKAVVGSLIL